MWLFDHLNNWICILLLWMPIHIKIINITQLVLSWYLSKTGTQYYFWHIQMFLTTPIWIDRIKFMHLWETNCTQKISLTSQLILEIKLIHHFVSLSACSGIPDHKHLGWLNIFVTSTVAWPQTKIQVHTSTYSWDIVI